MRTASNGRCGCFVSSKTGNGGSVAGAKLCSGDPTLCEYHEVELALIHARVDGRHERTLEGQVLLDERMCEGLLGGPAFERVQAEQAVQEVEEASAALQLGCLLLRGEAVLMR